MKYVHFYSDREWLAAHFVSIVQLFGAIRCVIFYRKHNVLYLISAWNIRDIIFAVQEDLSFVSSQEKDHDYYSWNSTSPFLWETGHHVNVYMFQYGNFIVNLYLNPILNPPGNLTSLRVEVRNLTMSIEDNRNSNCYP